MHFTHHAQPLRFTAFRSATRHTNAKR